NPQPLPLTGAGTTIASAAFVRKGDSWGLWLREKGRARAGLAFDFNRSNLVDSTDGWQPAAPDLGDWSAAPKVLDTEQGRRVWVRRGNQEVKAIDVRARAVTALALLPPQPPRPPLLAVAYLDSQGMPLLGLYNVASGEQVRKFTGHVADITSLAFAADGRLL